MPHKILFKLFPQIESFYWSDVLLRTHLTKRGGGWGKGFSSSYIQSHLSLCKPAAMYPKKLSQVKSLFLPFLPRDTKGKFESEDQNFNIWKRFLRALKWLCSPLDSFTDDRGQIRKREQFLEICLWDGFSYVAHEQKHQGTAIHENIT